MNGTATNRKTGDLRDVDVDDGEIGRLVFDSVCPCSGPCECDVEPDGVCPDGWPSVLLALGLI